MRQRRCSGRSSTVSTPVRARDVVDLYAGAGLFSVPLAEAAGPGGRVLAVEHDRRACEDARYNGRDLAALEVRQAAVTPQPRGHGHRRDPDAIVLDPPRQGAGTAVMRAVAALAPPLRSAVYVSCDPASLRPGPARHARRRLGPGRDCGLSTCSP